MRSTARLVLGAASLAALLTVALAVPGGMPLPSSDRASSVISSEGAEELTEPDDWMFAQRTFPTDELPARAFERAVAQAEVLEQQTAEQDPALAAAEWGLVGPTNIGGRVVDLAVDPTTPGTVFAAVATGGVWKTTDGGTTFSLAWPTDLSPSMGAIAIASNGTLYAGTGEPNNGGGSIVYGGTGVYRSTDKGATWEYVGLGDSGTIGRIAIDPTNPSRIFVAAAGDLFRPGGERGLYRSLDGGDTWQLVLAGANPTTGAIDVAIDPTNPQRVYTAMWDRVRFPDLRVYGGLGSGAFRSTDGGGTWTLMQGGALGLPAQSMNLGRIGLAVAPSDPNRLYAVVILTNGSFEGFYLSPDAGVTWVKLPTGTSVASSQSTFGWWFGRLWVDPVNAAHVFMAGVPMSESLNAGLTWASVTGLHADQHAMGWDPSTTGRVYLGNDGGFYRSDTNGASWTEATYQPFTQFYSVDVSEQDPARVVGGSQDNGCLRSWGGTDWNGYGCGDGLATLISPANQDQYYGCSQYGSCGRYGGGSFGSTTSTRRGWFTPLVFDPSDPNVMYYGGNRINRSTNGGGAWTAISADLTGGPGRDTQYPYGTMTTIAASKSDPSTIYLGTDDSRLWVTHDLGGSWTRIDGDPVLPERWVTRVAVDPADASTAYATFSGFREGAKDAHVFRTADGGETWEAIGAGLPDAPVNDVVIVGDALYVATDVGVYRGTEGLEGTEWLKVGANLPLIPITDIRYQAGTDSLFAATFGRGIMRVALP
ncbi:MAG TPA: glycosyl hydrolase [Actinomycetota bacterium]